MQLHLAYLQARELTPDRRLVVPLGRGNTLYVFHSVCSGSADGHCGEVDAFFDAGRDPVFDHQYPTMQRMEAIPGGFSITARSFKTTDPLCCPSGPTVTDRYAWHGGKLSRRGASQNEPGS
jgi:hypothetical protein